MYNAPIDDMRFALTHLAKMDEIAQLDGLEDATPDVIDAVLEEAGKLAGQVWAPTNRDGDIKPAELVDGHVKTSPGFKDAFQQFVDGGWNGLNCPADFGGQNLPWALSIAVSEMWQSANLSLSLCPLLSQAAIEAIIHHGSDQQKEIYLPKLISGEWTGTMHLTEPQAGTDLAAIKSVVTKDASGDFYRLKGQKIFITFGDHDFTDNIIHLVLARIDGLPEGNNGLGLFIVPKFMVNEDGSLGDRNDVGPVSLEHKLGIHGSPTCVMQYGDNDGAIAYLVGEEGAGLKNMFTMMNNARIFVGLQGLAVCEAAYQHALDYAKERVQGFALGDKSGKRVAIIEHPDVRRMLMMMKSQTAAARAMLYYTGGQIDRANAGDAEAAVRTDILTPLVKAWVTDLSVELASTGVQIHGGMGFVEETGAAQYYRDARILPIYEGANGVHNLDLVFRKVLRDQGVGMKTWIKERQQHANNMMRSEDDAQCKIGTTLSQALDDLICTTDWILDNGAEQAKSVAGSAAVYLQQAATVLAGSLLAELAEKAQEEVADNPKFAKTKTQEALFYAEMILPRMSGLMTVIMGGANMLEDMEIADF